MKAFTFLAVLSLFNTCCDTDFVDHYPYIPPEGIHDGLGVGTLEEVGIDSQIILKSTGRIDQGKYGEIHSMLIYKDNLLVFEKYFEGHQFKWDAPGYYGEWVQWNKTMPHQIMSCTKSFVSACIGIAIDQGYIESVHQSVFDYLPNHQQYRTEGRENITIEHLLTMSSGLKWDEWNAAHATAANDIDRLYIECWENPLNCVLERPLVSKPGDAFTYNGGGMITLGEILKNAIGVNMIDFAKHNLFLPLGIDTIQWDTFPKGEVEAGGGLHLTPRDMVKFGVLYLNNGLWNGKQIINEEWVTKSSEVYRNNSGIKIPIEDSGKNGYGYTWWISEVGSGSHKTHMYRANGWGGQVIMVLPEKNTVVVFTGGNFNSKSHLFEILERFILPAIN